MTTTVRATRRRVGSAAPYVRPGLRAWLGLAWFGLTTVLLWRRDPIVGSLIVTDRCNLACRHCAVANLRRLDYPYDTLVQDLRSLHDQGVRILLLYGGEPLLWRDATHTIHDVVATARRIGFPWVGVVTNGTRGLDLPEADLVLVSVDGTRERHDAIRGRTYDKILANVRAATRANLCLYMAVNSENLADVEAVAELATTLPTVRGVSYNLHTPYPGTEALSLTPEQRRDVCDRIGRLIRRGYPVVNLASALPYVADLTGPRPCPQCVIVEDGEQWTCGRCIEIDGLCAQCGFLFAYELSLLFRGRPAVVLEALRRYPALLRPSPSRRRSPTRREVTPAVR
ncbi:MAG TPA: radical SAM protein [Propionibacteriaceae bacterium]|nr:radical SAM protein [Propionibacteriaceae bacterium]